MIKRISYCLLTAVFLSAACEKTTVEGPGGKSLTVTKPTNPTITRGDNEKVTIVVARTGFTGAVKATFKNLPDGVSVIDSDTNIEGNERTFTFSATDTAGLVENHAASVTVEGPDGMTATQEFRVSVKEKPKNGD
ncbi:MAG TPA: hypothetical protein VNT79_03490 [Phycisphaerae bacterium]|nr:hypothetical protein [Phycisphaerae bacterium]